MVPTACSALGTLGYVPAASSLYAEDRAFFGRVNAATDLSTLIDSFTPNIMGIGYSYVDIIADGDELTLMVGNRFQLIRETRDHALEHLTDRAGELAVVLDRLMEVSAAAAPSA